jgi:putative Ca2+/H+ antiporter (TMEM165/GDT1 family)
MEALLTSISVVAIAEMGDKTQLLSLLLAARYRRAIPIMTGIFFSTLFNHLLAAKIGHLVAARIPPIYLHWGLALAFILMGLWIFIPDKVEDKVKMRVGQLGFWSIFWATAMVFFLAEIGDKTQIATVMLAIQYNSLVMVVVGSTLGMMLANIPAVLVGDWFSCRMNQLSKVRYVAALIFIIMGVLSLLA